MRAEPSVRDQVNDILFNYVRNVDKIRDRARGDHSVVRLLNGLVENPMNPAADAPRETAISAKIAERVGRRPQPGCAFLPVGAHRDLSAGSASGGGFLVESSNAGDVFVDALRAASVVSRLGVQELPLIGNALLPSVVADSTSYWLTDETTAITESAPTYGQVTLTPKTAGSYCELSGQFLRQISPAAEDYVLRGIAASVAAKVDLGAIAGSGASGQPLGIINTVGVGTQSGATLAWATVCAAIGDVEDSNGLVNPASAGWALAPDVAEILRARAKATGLGFIMANGAIDGRRAFVSKSVPSGNAIFGDWSQLVLGTWGTLEIGVNRADSGSTLFKLGAVGIRALWTVDAGVTNPKSFSVISAVS